MVLLLKSPLLYVLLKMSDICLKADSVCVVFIICDAISREA